MCLENSSSALPWVSYRFSRGKEGIGRDEREELANTFNFPADDLARQDNRLPQTLPRTTLRFRISPFNMGSQCPHPLGSQATACCPMP